MPLLQLFTAMLVLLLQLLNKMIVIVMINVFMIVCSVWFDVSTSLAHTRRNLLPHALVCHNRLVW